MMETKCTKKAVRRTKQDYSNRFDRKYGNVQQSTITTTKISDDILKITNQDEIIENEIQNPVAPDVWKNRYKAEPKAIGEKIFISRDSLLTYLMRMPHISTIYHIFIAMLIIMMLQTAVNDYITKGIINVGQKAVNQGMRGFWRAVGMWAVMQTSVILVYFGLKFWMDVRKHIEKGRYLKLVWDSICLWLYISFNMLFTGTVSYGVFLLDLGFATSLSIFSEMTRLQMKMYAFIRTNVPRIRSKLIRSEKKKIKTEEFIRYPKIIHFIYYMFAPTFIYRDSYPRSTSINWKFAMCRFADVIGVLFFIANIHERYIRPNFENFGIVEITKAELIAKLYSMILPAALILLTGFYVLLHAWLNFTGELLRFSDRMYYKDWWNSHNYEGYYRNWNVVVHDWLYEYIYKDARQYVFRGSKTAASLAVFTISAIVHEYIIGMTVRFFLPVLLVLFGIVGVGFIFLTRKIKGTVGNIFFWSTLCVGNCHMICLYAMEYYARQNCPVTGGSLLNYFVPVAFSCNGIK